MEPGNDGHEGRMRNRPTGQQDSKYFLPGPARRKVITRQYLNRIAEKRARTSSDDDGGGGYLSFDPVRHAVVNGQRVAAQLHSGMHRDDDEAPRPSRRRRAFQDEVSEGRALARSAVPLPYGGQGPIRRPTLGREEAFRDATTCKRSRSDCSTLADSVVSVVDDEADPETAQLYRMGLLYDDDYTRGSGFTLNTIIHDEPDFAVRYAKRQRKNGRLGAAASAKNHSYGSYAQSGLSLHLSFAQLGKDEMIAQYLISPSPSEFNPSDWETSNSRYSPGAHASVHSLQTDYFPHSTQDTQMSDAAAAAVPDLIKDEGSSYPDEPCTTQTPEFDCESDTTSLTGSDADLVILPLHLSREEDSRTRQSATPRRRSFDDNTSAAASWIMLGDDS